MILNIAYHIIEPTGRQFLFVITFNALFLYF